MKQVITSLFLLSFFNADAQLDKGIWLVGGTGNLLSSQNSYSSATYSSTSTRLDIGISPNVGYFVIDKLALGLKANFTKYKEQVAGSGGLYSNVNRFSFGPFAKYYFLDKDNRYNILVESSYQYGLYSSKPTKGSSNTFSAAIGPVVYFNSSVGLEFLLGYYNTKETIRNNGDNITKQSGFQIGIGFQIHLEN